VVFGREGEKREGILWTEAAKSGESAAAIHVQSTPAVAPRKNLELDKVPSR
jgi:hypothetical protein